MREDGLYTISEMARMFGISRQTLIYYDRIGLFKPAQVNDKGYRLYSPLQIPYLRLICMLTDLGLSLDEVSRLLRHSDLDAITEHLRQRVEALDAQAAEVERERADVAERLEFYDSARYWLAHEGEPELRELPERRAMFVPFPEGRELGRATLHTTLMQTFARAKELAGGTPMGGWGTMLARDALAGPDQLAGAGTFVLLPGPGEGATGVVGDAGDALDALDADEGASGPAASLCAARIEMMPAGVYLCQSRWGMPYDPEGIQRAMACVQGHALKPRGNAYDLCYLDTTSYDEVHQVDFCCIQIPVEL